MRKLLLLRKLKVFSAFKKRVLQVELENVQDFDMGYEAVWPIRTASAASSIAEKHLRSDNPLVNPPGSRFAYSYPFAAPGDDKAFKGLGGYYQVICAGKLNQREILHCRTRIVLLGIDEYLIAKFTV